VTVDEAMAWRLFWIDVYRVAKTMLRRAEKEVSVLPRGTPERRRASRVARERAALVGTLLPVIDDLSYKTGARLCSCVLCVMSGRGEFSA
jgi:hypothetical protein